MASLQGDASLLSIADLLQHLAAHQRSGLLTVEQGECRKVLFLNAEGIRLHSTSPRKATSLGQILLRTGKITRAELDRLLETQKRTGTRLGQLVARLGKVSPQSLQKALQEQVQEEIYDLFTWNEARFDFEADRIPENLPQDVVIDAGPTSIMLEAARRADEMQIIMKTIREETLVPFRTTRPFSAEGLGIPPDLATAIYKEINGRASVTEVARRSLYPRFDALRAMYVLLTKEFAKLLDREGATVMVLEHETKARKKTTRIQLRPHAQGKTILLLGDLVKYRGTLAQILRAGGFQVVEEVASGMFGLLARKMSIDAVILDVSLNIEDGFLFLKWVRENLGVPIVVLSADPSRESGLRALELGARSYVVKPFSADLILRTIGNLFERVPSN